jgi:hypothetical protein
MAERKVSGVSSDDEAPGPEVRDPTRPGRPEITRRRGLRLTARLGGAPLLSNAWLNRGTAFDADARAALGLDGLLPPAVETLDLQAERVMEQLNPDNLTDLNRYNVLKDPRSKSNAVFQSSHRQPGQAGAHRVHPYRRRGMPPVGHHLPRAHGLLPERCTASGPLP